MVAYIRKPRQVEAMYNDGTEERARDLIRWFADHGGEWDPGFAKADDLDAYIVWFSQEWGIEELLPDHWVVFDEEGDMVVCSNNAFHDTFIETHDESNLVKHAKRELELIDEEKETIEGYLRIIQAFADMGHSGGSAAVAIPTINQLLQFKNLKPLTDDPDEWIYHGPDRWDGNFGVWQNSRNSEAFSKDGGKTYYLLSEELVDGKYQIMHESVKSGKVSA